MTFPDMKNPLAHLPTVAIVGRTNVGKSSLFNRLTESRHAIVAPQPGTTRDRTYGTCRWRGREIRLIDTGGMDASQGGTAAQRRRENQPPADELPAAILRQTETALREADLILLVVDGSSGVLAADRELARRLQRLSRRPRAGHKPPKVLVACNKLDRAEGMSQVAEWFQLGLGTPWPVSAKNGRGSGDLLDAIVAELPTAPTASPLAPAIRVGLVGKPNVGKSSLVNRLCGSERVIVSPVPLTTRETQEVELDVGGVRLVLVDTAGIKPWRKVARGIEHVATGQSLAALAQLDVAVLVVEAHLPITHQDQALAHLIRSSGAGYLVAANKWDLCVAPGQSPPRDAAGHFQRQLSELGSAPVVTCSAETSQNVARILDWVVALQQRRATELSPTALAEFTASVRKRHRPVGTTAGVTGSPRGQRPRVLGLEQIGVRPPVFQVLVGPRQSLHLTYRRFLERQLEERFELGGANVKLYVRQSRPAHRRPR